MAKARHPSAFPAEFTQMAQAVFTNQSIFPLTIPFSSHSKAATFRTRFYEFRRALRQAADLHNLKADHTSPSAMLLQGAETITSPRIDYSKPPVVIFQLQHHSEVYAEGLAFLSEALASAASAKQKQQQSPTFATREPSSLEYHNFTTNRGNSYSIPSTDITDSSIHSTGLLQSRVQLVESRLERSSSFLKQDIEAYRTDNIKDNYKPSGTYISGSAGQSSSIPEPTGYTDPDLA